MRSDIVTTAMTFAGIPLKNPVLVASGTFGYGREIEGVVEDVPISSLGGIILKTVTLEPRKGNPGTRTVETYGGLLNTIGLQNIGIRAMVEEVLPGLQGCGTAIIVNIGGSTVEEYVEVARILRSEGQGYDGVELNISCPNVKEGGFEFGTNRDAAARVVGEVKAVLGDAPLIAKMTPHATDMPGVAVACVRAGADAVSVMNTLLGMAINIRTRKPILGNNFGGLSGPAVKPIALARTCAVYQRFLSEGIDAPILGLGGIGRLEDALEFLIAGASAVAVGTATFYDPTASQRLVGDLERFLKEESRAGRSGEVKDLVGSLVLNKREDLLPRSSQ
ncbi:MAG TPA: dihydroorotate dehydrogenase [Armatimonadota bacterium]